MFNQAYMLETPDQDKLVQLPANFTVELLDCVESVGVGLVSESQLTLTTDADSQLGYLIDGDALSFAVLQRFNRFKQAHTDVSVVAL